MTIETNDAVMQLKDIDGMQGSISQRTYLSLRESIMNFQLMPGEYLSKSKICSHFGISRAPVSEALTRLSLEGLVDIIPQSGTRVSLLSMKEIEEGAFLREAIEMAAVAKVAQNRTPDQLVRLGRNLRIQRFLLEDLDYEGFYQADEEMHDMIMTFTNYSRIITVASAAWTQVDRARRLVLPTSGRAQETFVEHELIVKAIEAQDPLEAQVAMHKHLSKLVGLLQPLEQERSEFFKLQ